MFYGRISLDWDSISGCQHSKYYGITSTKISQLLLLLYFTSDMPFKNDKARVVLEFTEAPVRSQCPL